MYSRDVTIPQINSIELKARIGSVDNLVMIDIRRPEEWSETGIIPGSSLITMDKLGTKIDDGYIEKLIHRMIIIICRSGNRSGDVTSFLQNYYNLNAINLSGGILGWKLQKYEVDSY